MMFVEKTKKTAVGYLDEVGMERYVLGEGSKPRDSGLDRRYRLRRYRIRRR